MKVIKPHIKNILFHKPDGFNTIEEFLERIARTCYQSEGKIKYGSAEKLLKKLLENGHHAMFEHCIVTIVIEADRGFTHELVRHRIAAFAQESSRWCNYSGEKFGGEITVIEQPGLNDSQRTIWEDAMKASEIYYMKLINAGVPAEIARSVLPIGLKSEIVITANLREWMHIFSLRTSNKAHKIMQGIMRTALSTFEGKIPVIFKPLADKFLRGACPVKEGK